MQTIKIISVTKYAGAEEILSQISFQIDAGKKYGLIGANGCGKTTLLNIICGEDSRFEGSLQKPGSPGISYVKQHLRAPDDICITDFLLKDFDEIILRLRSAEEKMADPCCPDMERAMVEYNKAREVYDRHELDIVISKMEGILEALGLGGRGGQRIRTLSGGEKNMLSLAGALLTEPDLLVLDEPGNHLDFQGLDWLESFLIQFKQSILIVSHNRYLLDRVCDHIIEIENRTATTFKGNYTAFRMNKLKHLLSRQAEYSANQKRLEQLEQLVKKFREIASRTADPAWGKRLRSRKTQLRKEKERAVAKPVLYNRKMKLALDTEETKATIALRIKNYSKSFGKNRLFDEASMEFFCGEKVGLVGGNGCGKTTLLRDIVHEGHWDHPCIRVGPSLTIGYMAQHPDIFSPEKTLEEEIRSLGPLTRNDAFHILSRFLFSWQDMDKTVSCLSGGELNRLQLASIFYKKPNFLILDEPTNHLDILSREAVEEAVYDFKGTLLVVSHDRYFLDKVIDRVVEVKDGKFSSFTGSFSEYWQTVRLSGNRSGGRLSSRQSERNGDREERDSAEMAALEAKIMEEEAAKEALEKRIANAFHKGDLREGKKLSAKLERCIKLIEKLYYKYG